MIPTPPYGQNDDPTLSVPPEQRVQIFPEGSSENDFSDLLGFEEDSPPTYEEDSPPAYKEDSPPTYEENSPPTYEENSPPTYKDKKNSDTNANQPKSHSKKSYSKDYSKDSHSKPPQKGNPFSNKDLADLKKNYTNNGKIRYEMRGEVAPSENRMGVLDCSSFVQWAMEKYRGIKNFPRQTDDQYFDTKGKKIANPKDLKKGDLVFFKNTDKNCTGCRKGITHVGIYVGKGKFVHNSSGKGQVTVSSLKNSYYKEHYYGGKRVKK